MWLCVICGQCQTILNHALKELSLFCWFHHLPLPPSANTLLCLWSPFLVSAFLMHSVYIFTRHTWWVTQLLQNRHVNNWLYQPLFSLQCTLHCEYHHYWLKGSNTKPRNHSFICPYTLPTFNHIITILPTIHSSDAINSSISSSLNRPLSSLTWVTIIFSSYIFPLITPCSVLQLWGYF